jgi:hypothetical protein
MQPQQVQRLRAAWLAALVCVTGCVLFAYGFLAAVLTALAFVGATVLAFVAFILYVLLDEGSVVLRVLLIALFFGGLAVEINGLVRAFGPVR